MNRGKNLMIFIQNIIWVFQTFTSHVNYINLKFNQDFNTVIHKLKIKTKTKKAIKKTLLLNLPW